MRREALRKLPQVHAVWCAGASSRRGVLWAPFRGICPYLRLYDAAVEGPPAACRSGCLLQRPIGNGPLALQSLEGNVPETAGECLVIEQGVAFGDFTIAPVLAARARRLRTGSQQRLGRGRAGSSPRKQPRGKSLGKPSTCDARVHRVDGNAAAAKTTRELLGVQRIRQLGLR